MQNRLMFKILKNGIIIFICRNVHDWQEPTSACFVFYPLSYTGVSHITPVYKHKGSTTDPQSYHPIAVLPTLAMVLLTIIY